VTIELIDIDRHCA